MNDFDICIVGAGVIGLATAFKLSQAWPDKSIILIEQEKHFANHTSSRNSEVIHAGIYYPQSSDKALLCRQGREQLYHFCQQYKVAHKKIGKLIVAPQSSQQDQLVAIKHAAELNHIALEVLSQQQCQQLEPNVKAYQALFSAETGIIDSHQYMQTLLTLSEQQGVMYLAQHKIVEIEKHTDAFKVSGQTANQNFSFSCEQLINCAGLFAQQLAENIEGVTMESIPQLHLCHGRYFNYSGKSPFNHLIYPTIDKNSAGLGIHSTLDLSGQLKFGPDTEYNSELSYQFNHENCLKDKFHTAIKSYFPKVEKEKLQPGFIGIRPKLQATGQPVRDFEFPTERQHSVAGLINLYGIESPGLTSSLAIADKIKTLLSD